jgi:hypothetical protein
MSAQACVRSENAIARNMTPRCAQRAQGAHEQKKACAEKVCTKKNLRAESNLRRMFQENSRKMQGKGQDRISPYAVRRNECRFFGTFELVFLLAQTHSANKVSRFKFLQAQCQC